jgi:hypothetical protein
VSLFIGFVPLSATLIQGQDSILLLALFILAWKSLKSDELRAGLFLGLGIFKFHIVLPVAALFFLWNRKRFIVGFLGSSAFCLLISVWITGAHGILQYAEIIRRMNDPDMFSFEPRLMPNLRGLANMLLGGRIPFLNIWIVFCSIVVFAAVALWHPRDISDRFLTTTVLVSLISYHVLAHDLSLLLLPIAVMANYYLSTGDFGRLGIVAAAFCGAALVAISPSVFPLAAVADLFFLIAICTTNTDCVIETDTTVRESVMQNA